jgi:hypothetical protein
MPCQEMGLDPKHRDLFGQKHPKVTVTAMANSWGAAPPAQRAKQPTKQRASITQVGQREAQMRAESCALFMACRPMTGAAVGTNANHRPSGTVQGRVGGVEAAAVSPHPRRELSCMEERLPRMSPVDKDSCEAGSRRGERNPTEDKPTIRGRCPQWQICRRAIGTLQRPTHAQPLLVGPMGYQINICSSQNSPDVASMNFDKGAFPLEKRISGRHL